jgi:hypothetical protein
VQVHEQGFESEFVTINTYGVMQTALMVAIFPVVLYFMITTFHGLKTKVKADMDEFSHRHDHRHVSEAEDHTVIAQLQDENPRLCEQPDENGRPKKQGQRTQQHDMIAMLKDSLAKKDAELANSQVEIARLRGGAPPPEHTNQDPVPASANDKLGRKKEPTSPVKQRPASPRPPAPSPAPVTSPLIQPPPLHVMSAMRKASLRPPPDGPAPFPTQAAAGRARSFSPGRGASA